MMMMMMINRDSSISEENGYWLEV